jgi:hypothetical protein
MLKTTVISLAMTLTLLARPAAQVPSLSAVMQEKADNAQALLRPLVLGDFARIAEYAERLGRLTYTEVGSWQARPDTTYLTHANAFVEAVRDLREAARVRDVQRASAAYGALVSSCASCHQLVRKGRSVSLTPSAPLLDLAPSHE